MWSKISNVLKPRHDQDTELDNESPDLAVCTKLDLDPFTTHAATYHTSTPQTLATSTSRQRSRSLSDALFQSMSRSSKPPEADINDESTPPLIVLENPDDNLFNVQETRYFTPEPTTPALPVVPTTPPDPFSAHATTYYTPQTMIPVTPPQGAGRHTRKTSKEEDLICTLRTQLALQTELCHQYEVDLRARDELVEALGNRLDSAEKEGERRKSILKGWKKKVGELERACRHLEEEVDNSRQESMERSIMDEASGEALRMLHRQIAGLEREKAEAEKRETALRDEVVTLEGLVKVRSDDVQRMMNEVLWNRDESESVLKEGIKQAQEQMEMMVNVSINGDEELKDRYRAAEVEWEEQKVEFSTKSEALVREKAALLEELTEVKATLRTRDEEVGVLKGELDAQWKHSENASETIEGLKNDNNVLEEVNATLKGDVDTLEEKIGTLEVEWTEAENRRVNLEADIQELWSDREALETGRAELEEQIKNEREHAEDLTQALQEREDRVAELERERQYAQDNISRLEKNIRQLDAEVAECSQRIIMREADAEQLREEMSKMKRDHARVVDEQTRALQDATSQEGETRQRMELLVKEKAAGDVEMSTLKDRVSALKDEVERLRRQVHDLQQESADKEVKIVQITKQRAQDKEDMQGLNIALDSKQQELELLKRRLGVRGTAGSTPVQTSKVAQHQRRDSFAFSTPGVSRPPSAMSDSGRESVSAKDHKPIDTPSTVGKTVTLGKSLRTNAGAGGIVSGKLIRGVDGSMGPPPVKGRVSIGTPTPMGRVPSLEARLSSRAAQSGAVHRRVSSSTLKTSRSGLAPSPAPSTSQADEKENLDVSLKTRSLVPMLA